MGPEIQWVFAVTVGADYPTIRFAGRSGPSHTTTQFTVGPITRHLFLRRINPPSPEGTPEEEAEGRTVMERVLGSGRHRATVEASTGRAFPVERPGAAHNGTEWGIRVRTEYERGTRNLSLNQSDRKKWELWGGTTTGNKFLFDAFAQGGWRIPGWIGITHPTPPRAGVSVPPANLRPWPTLGSEFPPWADTIGAIDLRIGTLSLHKWPTTATSKPTNLEATLITNHWRLCGTPTTQNTHTWVWRAPSTDNNHPQGDQDSDANPLTHYAQQIDGPEERFWVSLAQAIRDFDPDVVVTGHAENYVGPLLLQAATRLASWPQGWARFRGTPGPTLAHLADQFTLRWALGELWSGRVVCDPFALAKELMDAGGDLGPIGMAHAADPVAMRATRPEATTTRLATLTAATRLQQATHVTRLLELTALMGWVAGCPWQIATQSNSRLLQNEAALLRRFHAAGVAVPDAYGDGAHEGHAGGATVPSITGWHRHPTAKLDFASTYPSIICTRNVCFSPQADILPPHMRWLTQLRRHAKRCKAETTDASQQSFWHCVQLAFKLAANSIYGALGAKTFRFSRTSAAGAITGAGREALAAAVVAAGALPGGQVIYGTTDSVFIEYANADISTAWAHAITLIEAVRTTTGGLELELEGIFHPLYIQKTHQYFGLIRMSKSETATVEKRGTPGRNKSTCAAVNPIENCAIRAACEHEPDFSGALKMAGNLASTNRTSDFHASLIGWAELDASQEQGTGKGAPIALTLRFGGLPLWEGTARPTRLVPLVWGSSGTYCHPATHPESQWDLHYYAEDARNAIAKIESWASGTPAAPPTATGPRQPRNPAQAIHFMRSTQGRKTGPAGPNAHSRLPRSRQHNRYTHTLPPDMDHEGLSGSTREVPPEAWGLLTHPITSYYDGQGAATEPDVDAMEAWTEVIGYVCQVACGIGSHPAADQAARLLFLLPRMLLGQRGRIPLTNEEVLHNIEAFWSGQWDRLLPAPPTNVLSYTDQELASLEESLEGQPAPHSRGPSAPDAALQMAAELLQQGDKSKAARILVSPGMADRTVQSFVRLCKYHPSGTPAHSYNNEPSGAKAEPPEQEHLPNDDLAKILRQSGTHGAGGPSQWRKGLLVGLLNAPWAFQAWAAFLGRLMRGHVPADVNHVMGWCTLHGLLRSAMSLDVRPLGVGEFFRRNIGSTLLRVKRAGL